MSSFSTLPLIMNNQTFVSMKQLNNSSINVPSGTNLTNEDFENYLCHQLSKQVDPVDLSNNEITLPNSLTILDTSLNQTTIINNNDTVLVNERFAMKMEYTNQEVTSFDSWSYSVGGGSYITTKVALDPSSISLYDSNIKVDVSLNNNTQYTNDNEWQVDFDRTQTGMNYFACINSNLSAQNEESPFYLVENSVNIYALGKQPNSVYDPSGPDPMYGTNKYFTRDSSGIMVPVDICSNHTLDANFCRSELQYEDTSGPNAYEYYDNEFNTFKIIQDLPHVTNNIEDVTNEVSASGSDLPVQFNGANITASVAGSGGSFDIVDIFDSVNNNDWNKIGDGFQMTLTVGENQLGGYQISSSTPSDIFTLDQSNLTRDFENPYLTIDVQNTPHTVEVTNGSVNASSVNDSGNDSNDYMELGTEAETMTSSFYNVSGEVVIYTKPINNRVYYQENGGVNSFDGSNGTKSSLTDHVEVYYNSNEYQNNPSVASSSISEVVQTTDLVSYTVEVISSSTDSVVLNSDTRNLAKNSSALLVVSTPYTDLSINRVFDLSSDLPVNSETIQIVSIENQCILASNSPIIDQSGNSVSGSNGSVVIQHVNLDGLNYQDYRVYFTTKTVTDVSNLLQLNNGWSVTTTDPLRPQMIGNALKTGVIRDDYLFMTNQSNSEGQQVGLDISMIYTFEVASPVITGTQAIKHRISIRFLDLSNNTTYDDSETVFYLDDQDITLNPLDPSYITVEDPSCSNITQSSLNPGTYSPNNYQFRKFTSKRQFTASFDSKFQFYQNLLFVTPTIIEQSVYYEIYDQNGNKLPSYLLKYFQCGSHLLSNVYVSLVDQFDNDTTYSTEFNYTQEVCSILNVELYGSNDSVNYEPVPNTDLAFLDPFFNLKATINNFDGQNAIGTVNLQLTNSTTVNQVQYYIETSNKPGTNVSFLAKRYIYTVGEADVDGLLNNFSYYNDFYNNLPNMTVCDVVLEVSGNDNTLTISDGTGQLVTITHPSNFIDNYNVIVCEWPLFQVTSHYNNILQNQFYSLATNNTTMVDDGVYYFNTSNPSIGQIDYFSLVSDSFSLKFCNNNGVSFPNNTNFVNQTLFSEELINTSLNCNNNDDGLNLTKSVTFYLVRGYRGAYNGVPLVSGTYKDVIELNRIPSEITFKLYPIAGGDLNVNGTTAMQTFTNIYVGKQLTLDNVVGSFPNPQTYNLGLVLNIQESILSNSELNSYLIDVAVADYLVNIDSNPYDPDIIGVLNFGYLTDIQDGVQKNLLYPYIDGVRACSIKADSVYTVTINRNVPALRVYSLSSPSYIGDPVSADVNAGVWTQQGTIPYNDFVLTGYTISNLTVRRLAASGPDGLGEGHVVFYNDYYSYYVIAPPSVSVFGYPSVGSDKVNVYNLPISGFNSIFFKSFDIVQANSYTDNTHASSALTFSQPSPYYYTHYLFNPNASYTFYIESNYIRVSLYTGGVGPFGPTAGPDYVDSISTVHELLYDWQLITQLDNVSDYLSVAIDSSLNYNITYNQILYETASHNQTPNVFFTIGNPFTGPNTSDGSPSYYLRLPSPLGTSISFYQANIIYSDVSGVDGLEYGYYMVIDKFDTISNINYNQILSDPYIREVFFPVQFHETKQILLGSIVDENGNVIDQQTYLEEITLDDVINAEWISDLSFTTQYIGITISALSNAGANNIADLLKYTPGDALDSKALYVKRQDAIRLMNVLGNNLFRVTNSGNVQTQRVVTSNVSLYTPPNVMPNINSNIAGAADIISIFAQDTILNTGNPSL